MEKAELKTNITGKLTVDAHDVAMLAIAAHEMRARFSDPRMNAATRGLFAQTIHAVDSLVEHAGRAEEE